MRGIDEKLKGMTGASVFSMLNLTKDYRQLVLHPESKPITVSSSQKGLLQWKVVPSG